MRPVALMGRVPVKVNLEGGPIHVGDRIAVSSLSGIGKKAGPFDDSIGIAIDNFDGTGEQTVMTFLNLQKGVDINRVAFGLLGYDPSFFGLDASTTDDSLFSSPLDFVGGMMSAIGKRMSLFSFGVESTSTATSTDMSTSTGPVDTFAGGFLQSLVGALKQFFADASNGIGEIFAGTFRAKNEICVDDQCLNKNDVHDLLAMTRASSTSSTASAGAGASQSASAASTDIPRAVISIEGNNPATIHVGDAYVDLGATITGPKNDLNLGIRMIVDGVQTDDVTLDTSMPAEHTITYRVIDAIGQVSEKTRTVRVLGSSSDVLPVTDASSTSTTTSEPEPDTVATSSTPVETTAPTSTPPGEVVPNTPPPTPSPANDVPTSTPAVQVSDAVSTSTSTSTPQITQ